MALTASPRNSALDGLRGWAALSVLGYHFYLELGHFLMPPWLVLALSLIFNGQMAVAIFFVLSGYVLTVGGWGLRDKRPVLRQIVKRYPRLAVPILANTLVVFALMAAGLNFSSAAAQLVHRPSDWIGTWLHFEPSLGDALHYALIRVFELAPEQLYNPFLWTMFIELWMGFVVLLVSLGENLTGRRATYGILAFLLVCGSALSFGLGCFAAGALLALLHRDNRLSFRISGLPALGILTVCLAAAAIRQVSSGPGLQLVLLAPAVVLVALLNPTTTRLLSAPLSATLGRLSFPVYLMQFPVLISVTSWIVVMAAGALNLATIALIGTVSIAITFASATAFLPVEWLALWAGRELARLVPGRRAAPALAER